LAILSKLISFALDVYIFSNLSIFHPTHTPFFLSFPSIPLINQQVQASSCFKQSCKSLLYRHNHAGSGYTVGVISYYISFLFFKFHLQREPMILAPFRIVRKSLKSKLSTQILGVKPFEQMPKNSQGKNPYTF